MTEPAQPPGFSYRNASHEIAAQNVRQQNSSRRRLFILLRWFAALFVLALLIHFIPVVPLRNAISHVPLTRFLVVLFLYLVVLLVAAAKWQLVVNTAGAQLNFRACLQCFGSGLFGDLFLPSVIGGDIARLAVGISKSPRPAALITGNIADRILDAMSQLSLVALGIFLLPGALPVALQLPARRVLVFAMCAAAIALVVVILLRQPILRGRSMRFRRQIVHLRHALRALWRRPHLLFAGWLLGLTVQGSYVLLTALLGISCGLILPIRVWFLGWPLAKIAAVLPITQGGIGVREAALVALLVPFGAPAALVLATGIVWEGVIIAGGLTAGLVVFLLRYHGSNGTPP